MIDRNTAQIERINQVSAIARTGWVVLLVYVVFVGITLLGVEDADFFVPSRGTRLPLLGVAIPTASFFWITPVLGAALYTYLHLFLIKLWDAHDPPVAERGAIHQWLINDFALIRQADPVATARPLAWLTVLITRLLVWVLGPLFLGYAWWRSMPAHDEWLTLLIALCLGITLFVGVTSWSHAEARLRPSRRRWWHGWRKWVTTACAALLLVTVSWARTEGGAEYHAGRLIDAYTAVTGSAVFVAGSYPNGDSKPAAIVQEEWIARQWWIPKTGWLTFGEDDWPFSIWLDDGEPYADNTWNPLAIADLAGLELVALPGVWPTHETAQAAFRKTWCAREGLEMAVCDHPVSPDRPRPGHVTLARRSWCDRAGPRYPGAACESFFTDLDARFVTAWVAERAATLADLPRLSLAGRDLRNVSAPGVSLVDADLRGARLEGANLSGARLEGADLRGARLQGTDLREARLKEADLREARLEEADLWEARLEGADLRGAELEEADLWEARLAGADLRGARLEGAGLIGARLEGASLIGARLQGADLWEAELRGASLRGADLRKTNWASASIRPVLAQFTDFRGARALTQAQLDQMIGNEGTLLPDGTARDTGRPFHIWSCWETSPPGFDRIVVMAAGPLAGNANVLNSLRAEFLCSPGNPRRKTGTPLALEAPYPEGHPLGNEDG